MTTKKTRLMAGLMAALMLVSMMAAYALPAVAEVTEWAPEDSWIPVKTMTDFSNPTVGDYYVADLADLNTLATVRADGYTNGEKLPYGATIHLNPNADYNVSADDAANAMYAKHQWKASINGHGATIKGVTVEARDNYPAWLGYLGYSNGGAGKTITIENLLMDGWKNSEGKFKALLVWQNYESNLILDNITAINCTATNYTDVNGFGLLIGAVTGNNTNLTLKNIQIENCTLNRGSGDNAGFLVGSFGTWNNPTEVMTVDGVYLINNTITGTATSQKTGRGIVFGEVTGTGSIKNVAVFNTTIDSAADATVTNSLGIVVGGTKNNVSTLTVENVMAVNNGEKYTRIVHTTAGNAKVNVEKVYSDATLLVGGSVTNVSNANTYTEAQVKSGQAAYDANEAIAADADATDLKKWEMVAGATYPTFDADGKGQPVKVTLDFGEEETELYTDTNGNVIGLTAAHTFGIKWDGEPVTATSVYDQDVTVTGTLDDNVARLNELLEYFDCKDAKYFESATYEGDLSALIAEINEKKTTYDEEYYAEAVAALGSFGYKDYPDIPSASEYEAYSDSLHFIVNTIDDLNKVAEYKDKFTVDQTIHLAENVVITVGADDAANNMNGLSASINGHGSTIKGVTVPSTSWLASYDGKAVDNLVMDSWVGNSLNAYGALLIGQNNSSKLTLKNITAINCVATKPAGNGMAILLGKLVGATNVVDINNVSIKNCTLNRVGTVVNGNGGYDGGNSAFVVGQLNSGTLNLDGAYLDGNTINGDTNWNGQGGNSGGTGIVLGEVTGTANVSNVAVYNTTLGENADLYGVLAGEFKNNGVMTAKNVVVYNSTDRTVIKGSNTPTTSNIYTDTAVIGSGEAAYTMNQSSTTVKWEMAEGAAYPTFDTDGVGQPVAVTFKGIAPGDTENSFTTTLYTNTAKKLIGVDAVLDRAAWATDVTAATIFEKTITVKGDVVPDHTCTFDKAVKADEDGKHTLVCSAEWDSVKEGETFSCGAAGETVACTYTASYATVDENASFANAKHTHACVCGRAAAEAEACTLGDEVTVKEATATEQGQVSKTCALCKTTYYESTPVKMGLVVEDARGYQNGKMTVKVDVLNNTGLGGAVVKLTYDPKAIKLSTAELAMTGGQAPFPENFVTDPETGLITVTISFVTGSNYKGKDLMTLTFDVLGDAEAGNYTLKIEVEEAVNGDSMPAELLGAVGSFELLDYLPGDVVQNEKLSIADAVMLLRLVNEGEEALSSYQLNVANADINGNGAADLQDVIALLQYLNGSITLDDLYAKRAA